MSAVFPGSISSAKCRTRGQGERVAGIDQKTDEEGSSVLNGKIILVKRPHASMPRTEKHTTYMMMSCIFTYLRLYIIDQILLWITCFEKDDWVLAHAPHVCVLVLVRTQYAFSESLIWQPIHEAQAKWTEGAFGPPWTTSSINMYLILHEIYLLKIYILYKSEYNNSRSQPLFLLCLIAIHYIHPDSLLIVLSSWRDTHMVLVVAGYITTTSNSEIFYFHPVVVLVNRNPHTKYIQQ